MHSVERSSFLPYCGIVDAISSLMTKVAKCISIIWNRTCDAIKNFCSFPKNDFTTSFNESDQSNSDLQLKVICNRLSHYQKGQPLTEEEKTDLRTEKEKLEAIFAQEKLAWESATCKIKTPQFIAYSMWDLGSKMERLLNGGFVE